RAPEKSSGPFDIAGRQGLAHSRRGADRPVGHTDRSHTGHGKTRWYDGVANYGTRPTFGMTGDVLEVHLLDMNRDLYGQRLRVQLLGRIRPEQAFSGPDALKARIAADIDAARIILARGAVNHTA
ncbi:riboflavin kinase, partial [Haematospirillum jordaniae]|uniref:riboflavin kinase n=1 Tax=Haematospirillum jordaniae TaxID=1549855 RepID=UPI00169C24D8